MKNTILVTAIGSFSADITIKNLKKNDYNIIGCDIYPREWIVDAYNVNRFYQVPKAVDEEKYINRILEICCEEKVDIICPLTDVEIDVFIKYITLFEDKNIILTISSKKTIDICRNKFKTAQYLNGMKGIHVINSYDIDMLKNTKIDFPIVCKKINGRSSQDLWYLWTDNELKNFLTEHDMTEYVVQPFIDGNIITVDVVRNEIERKTVVVCRKELLRTKNGAGLSVHIFNDNILEELAQRMAEKLNINGCVNFEFIENKEGVKYFLECNPRFSGGVEFSCIAGYDFVSNHIRCFINKEIESKSKIKNQFICRKYEEYVTALR